MVSNVLPTGRQGKITHIIDQTSITIIMIAMQVVINNNNILNPNMGMMINMIRGMTNRCSKCTVTMVVVLINHDTLNRGMVTLGVSNRNSLVATLSHMATNINNNIPREYQLMLPKGITPRFLVFLLVTSNLVLTI